MSVTMRKPVGVEAELIEVINQEIKFLQHVIAQTVGGGWSTQSVAPMQDRVKILMAVVYKYEHA